MFGYVTAYKPEMKIKEYEAYKGVYCTLCKSLGNEYGIFSRFLLSYDGAFYVIYKLGLSGECVTAENSRCTFNPAKKCMKICAQTDIYKLASAITVILAYYKLVDNIYDGKFLKKAGLLLIRPYFSHLKDKAGKKYPDILKLVDDGMKEQFATEKNSDLSIDKSADASAKMLSELFAYGESGVEKEFSQKFGYLLGRAVYVLDAFDDYERDKKNGEFNPFVNCEDFISDASLSARLTIGELINIKQEKTFNNFSPIVDNIICDGLNFQLEKILKKYRGDDFE